VPRRKSGRLTMASDGTAPSPAEIWAATILPASRAHPCPPDSPEPAHAEALLATCARQQAAPQHANAPGTVTAQAGELHDMGVCDLLAAFAAGSADPPAVLAALRARSCHDGPSPEAVLWHIPTAAADAAASAERYRNGTARPLEGIPVGVKDIIDVAGARVTCASLQTGDRVAEADATVVARLRAAGAIPAFMLASSEYACGAIANARYGAVPNPWDRTRWAGGSSTGSGAALAARIVPLALGTDTGGSIRVPASCCGITGFKPTRGLVPRTGVATLSWTLDHIGPMARNCTDIARVLPMLAGPDGHDPLAAAHTPDLAPRRDIAGLRIGVAGGWFTARCDDAVLRAWRAALDVLADAGAVLVPLDAPDLALAHEEAWVVLYAELASCQESRDATFALFDSGTRDRIRRGRAVTATDYLRALRRRPLMQQAMLDAMADIDVLVTPGAGAEAPFMADITVDVDGKRVPMYEITPRNTMIFDYTGFPALMLPAGLGAAGLPVAIQLVGKPFQDALCLAVGITFQERTEHHKRKNVLF